MGTKEEIIGVAIRPFINICERIKAQLSRTSLLYKKAYKGIKDMAFSSWGRIISYSMEICNIFNSAGLAIFCQYALKGSETRKMYQNCKKTFVSPILYRQKA